MKISRHLLIDLIKNKVLIGSFLLFAFLGWGTFLLEQQVEKSLLILLQVSLLAIPLITLVFSSIYYYNASDFITLILSQPIERGKVIRSLYTALSISFTFAYLLGIGLPILVFNPSIEGLFLILNGILLIFIFVAMALWISTAVKDKVKGMGITLILWTFFAFLFDGILLFLMYQFGEYPIESTILGISFLNPIDIARISVIMQTEASALMGLSGAIFTDFFGSQLGSIISFTAMLIWASVSFFMARWNFLKKDL
jgi:Cu-processing system permease protein